MTALSKSKKAAIACTEPATKHSPKLRGVFVPLDYIDMFDGDEPAARLISQIIYWFQIGDNGKPRITRPPRADGTFWLSKTAKELEAETRLTRGQIDRIKKLAIQRGIIFAETHGFGGNAATFYRLVCARGAASLSEYPSVAELLSGSGEMRASAVCSSQTRATLSYADGHAYDDPAQDLSYACGHAPICIPACTHMHVGMHPNTETTKPKIKKTEIKERAGKTGAQNTSPMFQGTATGEAGVIESETPAIALTTPNTLKPPLLPVEDVPPPAEPSLSDIEAKFTAQLMEHSKKAAQLAIEEYEKWKATNAEGLANGDPMAVPPYQESGPPPKAPPLVFDAVPVEVASVTEPAAVEPPAPEYGFVLLKPAPDPEEEMRRIKEWTAQAAAKKQQELDAKLKKHVLKPAHA